VLLPVTPRSVLTGASPAEQVQADRHRRVRRGDWCVTGRSAMCAELADMGPSTADWQRPLVRR
jgi:hypothetical protein